MENPIISFSIPHRVITKSGEAEFQRLDYKIDLPDRLLELEPFVLNALLQKAISVSLNLIALNPDWLNSCKLASEKNLNSLQDSKIRITSKITTIELKSKRTPSEAFLLLHGDSKLKGIEDMIRELY